jgi:TolB-like protein/Tfp pilus assembly protein PilF/rhodanese-related sulfurtransferase
VDAAAAGDVVLFGEFRFDRSGSGLFRADGSPVPLGSRALASLQLLIERQGQLVSKQQIMDAVWPGLAVEDGNLTVQMSALRKTLDQGRAEGSCIQTIPGRGYRFMSRVTHVMPDGGFGRPGTPPRLSMVVLPFANLSGNPEDNYLAETVTDDLTTDISRIAGMFVIGRESAYTYQGKAVDVRKIGTDLGVRYVVQGSVRKVDDVLRVNAQLVAADTGAHIWAERFDQPQTDRGAGQEEIAGRIAETLNVALTDIESARSKRERPANPDTFDLIIRARALSLHTMGTREYVERRALYEEALRLDPTSILAMTGLADDLIRLTFHEKSGDELKRAEKLIAAAAAINPNHPAVLEHTAFLLYARFRYAEAVAAYQRLLEEYPNAPGAYSQIGYNLVYMGRAEEAIPLIEEAIRRDPRSPRIFYRYENMGHALLSVGRDEESIVWTKRALAANPNIYPEFRAQYNLRLVAAHARLGQFDEARRALDEAHRIWPYETVRGRSATNDHSSPVRVAQVECFKAALRLAGLRDHADEDADFGIASDKRLRADLAGLTPTTVPGATTIHTAELEQFLAERKPVVIDSLVYYWGRSIPGAIGLKYAGYGGSYSDAHQDRLRAKMQALTSGDLSKPIVTVGWNSERFDGRNLALRLVALGYTNVHWYRGGREAWEVNGLPETEIDVQEW